MNPLSASPRLTLCADKATRTTLLPSSRVIEVSLGIQVRILQGARKSPGPVPWSVWSMKVAIVWALVDHFLCRAGEHRRDDCERV